MSDNKNIDRLFQEKFKDYEVFPEPSVWKGIENELLKKKKKRRIIPLWLRLAGAAAILLLLIPTGYWFYNNNDTKTEVPDINTITNTDNSDNSIKENKPSDDVINSKEDINGENLKQIQVAEKLITTTQQTNQKNTTNKKTNIVQQNKSTNNTSKNNDAIAFQQKAAEQQENKATNELKVIEQLPDSQETKVATSENELEENKKDIFLEEIEKQNTLENIADVNNKKWSIGSTIGPVYLNSSGKGSPIDPSLANNSKSSNNSISYGLKVNYKISDKFSLQSGIQNVDLGYSTENVSVIASSALLDQSKTNINSDVGATLEVSSTESQNSETFSQRSPFDSNGSLDQSFSYIEVPLEAKYAIVQKKMGINLVGGVSTYFLYDNNVSMTSFGKKTSLGEASNLNDLNFSGNIGLDVNYNLSPNLFINASPMFKYQLNTFSENSGGFKPYLFGIYAGLNFRF